MFFKKKKTSDNEENFSKIAALLIHAAKIDENFSQSEENIVKETIFQLGAKKEQVKNILEKAKKIENNANQILDFTKEVKNLNNEDKIKIVEALWKIIYSNKEADIYETSLMRRLAGLLYIDSKTMGDIKEKVKTEISE
tara:strand:+ start:1088 stop:1504 length:417 start_codon:yes stop_codon:yes gene_type:complete